MIVSGSCSVLLLLCLIKILFVHHFASHLIPVDLLKPSQPWQYSRHPMKYVQSIWWGSTQAAEDEHTVAEAVIGAQKGAFLFHSLPKKKKKTEQQLPVYYSREPENGSETTLEPQKNSLHPETQRWKRSNSILHINKLFRLMWIVIVFKQCNYNKGLRQCGCFCFQLKCKCSTLLSSLHLVCHNLTWTQCRHGNWTSKANMKATHFSHCLLDLYVLMCISLNGSYYTTLLYFFIYLYRKYYKHYL